MKSLQNSQFDNNNCEVILPAVKFENQRMYIFIFALHFFNALFAIDIRAMTST